MSAANMRRRAVKFAEAMAVAGNPGTVTWELQRSRWQRRRVVTGWRVVVGWAGPDALAQLVVVTTSDGMICAIGFLDRGTGVEPLTDAELRSLNENAFMTSLAELERQSS